MNPTVEPVRPTTPHPSPLPQQIPPAADGLCWGGFFLSWIWALGNNTWIGLIALIPVVGLVMPFVLLFKGREWAWKNKQWQSVEDFNSTQRIWTLVGLAVPVFAIGVGIIAAIAIPNFMRFQAKTQQTEAKAALLEVLTFEKAGFAENSTYSENLQQLGFSAEHLNNYQVGFASTDPEFAKQCSDCTATAAGFKAVAVGTLGSGQKLDVWTIDQDRNLVNVIDGTK